MAESHLLVTKFMIPPLRAELLPRAALIERLNQYCALPLVLLSAGAGFGKTTLLAAWANQRSHLVAWLSLDSLDNDPLRFWSAMIAVLRTRLPTVGDAALAQLHAPQPLQLIPLLTSLINDFEARDQREQFAEALELDATLAFFQGDLASVFALMEQASPLVEAYDQSPLQTGSNQSHAGRGARTGIWSAVGVGRCHVESASRLHASRGLPAPLCLLTCLYGPFVYSLCVPTSSAKYDP